MPTSRFRLSGLIAVLLALMAQLGAGAAVPRIDPVAAVGALCHADDDSGPPANGPTHAPDCLTCPLCTTLHAQPMALACSAVAVVAPAALGQGRIELPPPATGPPTPHRPPCQPRAPPTES